MPRTIVGLGLLAGSAAFGQVPEPPPEMPVPLDSVNEMRKELAKPDSELSKLAAKVFGKKSGNQLFYLPTHDEPATPAKWGFDFENVKFASEDGTPLHGWFLPAHAKKAKGTIVFSHGNAGALGHHLGFVLWLVEGGYNVMMYDYRGFGKSGGEVDRRGMINDVKAAFATVIKRADIDPARIISFGHSLGGAKSVTALGETPVKGLRAVVIDATFSSYRAMAKIVAGQLGAELVTDELSPLEFIEKLPPVPLLVVHGDLDEVVPFAQGRALFDKAHEPKTLFEVKAGTHGGSLARDQGAYRAKLLAWLDENLKS